MVEEPTDYSVLDGAMVDIDGSEMPFSFRSVYEGTMAALKAPFLHTQNPIFVWTAIRYHIAYEAVVRLEADQNWAPWLGSMPAWCTEYLFKCANEVRSMQQTYAQAIASSQSFNCASSVSSSFGFTRMGWNAFNEARALGAAQKIAESLDRLRESGKSPDEAMWETMVRFQTSDRNVRRKIAKGRRLAKKNATAMPDKDQTKA